MRGHYAKIHSFTPARGFLPANSKCLCHQFKMNKACALIRSVQTKAGKHNSGNDGRGKQIQVQNNKPLNDGSDSQVKATLQKLLKNSSKHKTDRKKSQGDKKAGQSELTTNMQPASKPIESQTPFLTDKQLLEFYRDGCVMTRKILSESSMQALSKAVWLEVESRTLEAYRHRIRVLCPNQTEARIMNVQAAKAVLEAHSNEQIGFLQTFNCWRNSHLILDIAETLAPYAASLLDCKSVRLYQDCAFLKEPGFDATNWHSDLRMSPLDTSNLVTAWIPLRKIKGNDDSGLTFALGSHTDFAFPFWYGDKLDSMDLSSRGYRLRHTGNMGLGDVNWHHGWTVHCAPPQPEFSESRLALSISYFKDGARVLPGDIIEKRMKMEDKESYATWLLDIKPGKPARHKLLPLMSSLQKDPQV